jgi:hypothetical protein
MNGFMVSHLFLKAHLCQAMSDFLADAGQNLALCGKLS